MQSDQALEGFAMKTIQELAKDAINVQDACNLSGVLISAAKMIQDLRAACPELGTDALNRHPIAVAWADKIASLTRIQGESGSNRASEAHRAVTDLAYPRPEEPSTRQCGKLFADCDCASLARHRDPNGP